MIQMLQTFRSEIEAYCHRSGLSVDKVFSSAHCGNNKWVALQHYDPNSKRAKRGLLDETPAPITLKIYLEDGKLRFEQTDITRKYLGVENESVVPRPDTKPVRPSVPKRSELAYA